MANNNSSPNNNNNDNSNDNDNTQFRDIHALSPANHHPRREMDGWDASSHRSYSLSAVSEGPSSENFTTMSREFNALVLAGSANNNNGNDGNDRNGVDHIGTIREEEAELEETNPLAIVPDVDLGNPVSSFSSSRGNGNQAAGMVSYGEVSVHKVKKEEVEAKISAWQNAKLAKINNRFKREDAIISGQENEEVQKSYLWMQKVERKLEEKRARAMEKMQNDIAKAQRKAQEKRASAEARKGTKMARTIELANLMRTVGRAPAKRSFF